MEEEPVAVSFGQEMPPPGDDIPVSKTLLRRTNSFDGLEILALVALGDEIPESVSSVTHKFTQVEHGRNKAISFQLQSEENYHLEETGYSYEQAIKRNSGKEDSLGVNVTMEEVAPSDAIPTASEAAGTSVVERPYSGTNEIPSATATAFNEKGRRRSERIRALKRKKAEDKNTGDLQMSSSWKNYGPRG